MVLEGCRSHKRARHIQDLLRQRARATSVLPEGRPVLPQTAGTRDKLLEAFGSWLLQRGTFLNSVITAARTDVEDLVRLLNDYGRELFAAGIHTFIFRRRNAIASKRPTARRQLQGAWDLAFAWLSTEPTSHHVAMPAIILLALLSVSLLWGWRSEAGIYALCFGGLLRIGEAVQATRGCLVLPRDVLFLHQFALLRIQEPKTRLRAARPQSAKIEASDLVELIDIAFGSLPSSSRLWPLSAQPLRRRLDSALERLGIPTARTHSQPLDLGSFRPGGATHLLGRRIGQEKGAVGFPEGNGNISSRDCRCDLLSQPAAAGTTESHAIRSVFSRYSSTICIVDPECNTHDCLVPPLARQ